MSRTLLRAVMALTLVVTTIVVARPAAVEAAPQPGRISGEDGLTTAIELSRRRFGPAGAELAVLSRDDDWADALSATPFTKDGPLLFTPTASLDARTRAEIIRAVPRGGLVYIVGGREAVSEEVEAQLRADGFRTHRLFGADRFWTNLNIAEEVRLRYGLTEHPVAVVRGVGDAEDETRGWADALSIGAWAAETSTPVLLVRNRAPLPEPTRDWLASREEEITHAVVVGGESAISDSLRWDIERTLDGKDVGQRTSRIAGRDRVSTAVSVAETLWAPLVREEPRKRAWSGRDFEHYAVYNGFAQDGWMYGLAAAGWGADHDAPVLPSPASTTPTALSGIMNSCYSTTDPTPTLIGPMSSLPTQRLDELRAARSNRPYAVMIAARGSGQNPPTYEAYGRDGIGSRAEGMMDKLVSDMGWPDGEVRPVGVKYPAVKVGRGYVYNRGELPGYTRSVDAGLDDFRDRLAAVRATCDPYYFVFAGYSQGAEVMGTATKDIPGALHDRVLAISLFADPLYSWEQANAYHHVDHREPHSNPEYGSFSDWRRSGFGYAARSYFRDFPASQSTEDWHLIDLWCHPFDMVCAYRDHEGDQPKMRRGDHKKPWNFHGPRYDCYEEWAGYTAAVRARGLLSGGSPQVPSCDKNGDIMSAG